MDLANNLKKTSDEVKTLKQVIGLAKHDLTKVTIENHQMSQVPTKTINPFASVQGLNMQSSQSVYNQLMNQQDAL